MPLEPRYGFSSAFLDEKSVDKDARTHYSVHEVAGLARHCLVRYSRPRPSPEGPTRQVIRAGFFFSSPPKGVEGPDGDLPGRWAEDSFRNRAHDALTLRFHPRWEIASSLSAGTTRAQRGFLLMVTVKLKKKKGVGFKMIPNPLYWKLVSSGFSGGEFALFLIVFAKTKGWGKERDQISLSQMLKFSGLDLRTVQRARVVLSCWV